MIIKGNIHSNWGNLPSQDHQDGPDSIKCHLQRPCASFFLNGEGKTISLCLLHLRLLVDLEVGVEYSYYI